MHEEALKQGIDTTLYDHRVYVMYYRSSGIVGAASTDCDNDPSIPGWMCYAAVYRCRDGGVYVHELGHNLAMAHAADLADVNEGDQSDIMKPVIVGGSVWTHFNAPHKEQMGWFEEASIQEVTASGTYQLAPIELNPEGYSPAPNTALQVLKIPKTDTGEFYYVSLRSKEGTYSSGLQQRFTEGVSIHTSGPRILWGTPDWNNYERTFLQKVLVNGDSFVDSVNNLTIRQVDSGANQATLEIEFPGCFPTKPELTLTPNEQFAEAGQWRKYQVSVANSDIGCGVSTFDLSTSIIDPRDGFSLRFNSICSVTSCSRPSSLSLMSGQIGHLDVVAEIPFYVTEADRYEFIISVADNDGETPSHSSASVTGSLTLVVAGTSCGNGLLESGEECDDGNNINGDGCSFDCKTESPEPFCGDGNLDIQSGEECDDGNNLSGDGCSFDCKIEPPEPFCGDGNLDLEIGEECDDGNNINGDGCSSDCKIESPEPFCGDGNIDIQSGEECDDGNNLNGDGCDSNCKIESLPTLTQPTNLSARISGRTVILSWRDNTSLEDGYSIERGTKRKGKVSYSEIDKTTENATTFSDSGLTSGTFYYRVRAFINITSEYSDYSNEVSIRLGRVKGRK